MQETKKLESRCKKNNYKFGIGAKEIVISSDFDSGNIELVKQTSETNYRLAAVSDYVSHVKSKKTWFYFKIKAFKNFKAKIVIENVDILTSAFQWELNTQMPVMKVGEFGKWSRVKDGYLSMREQLEIYIEHHFQSEDSVYFALTIPSTYQDNVEMVEDLHTRFISETNGVYFYKEVLTWSLGNRIVHLLTISQKEALQYQQKQLKFDSRLFIQDQRPIKFQNKPVVLISCRVHPGEVSSSHTLAGIIEFLLDQIDLRAYLLRKLFVFMIVPMVNPDGVYQGNYRMDPLNRNLNRLYGNPNFETEPSIYAIKMLVEHLKKQNRLHFYFDMHGHSSSKKAFIYGNALDDIVAQTESQLFCKVFELNTKFFDYDSCNFSEEQMMSKDKDQPLTKQGCSRVVFNKITQIVYCYTIQTGLHYAERQGVLQDENKYANIEFTYKNMKLVQKTNDEAFNVLYMCYEVGKNMMITILDILDRNPYSVLINSIHKNIDNARKQLGSFILQYDERFRKLDMKAYQKARVIDRIIKQQYILPIQRKWDYLAVDKQFCNFSWPIQGLKIFKTFRLREKRKNKPKSEQKKLTVEVIDDSINKNLETFEALKPKIFSIKHHEQLKSQLLNGHRIQSKSIEPIERSLPIRELQLPKIFQNMKINTNQFGGIFVKKRKEKNKADKFIPDLYPERRRSRQKTQIIQNLRNARLQIQHIHEGNKDFLLVMNQLGEKKSISPSKELSLLVQIRSKSNLAKDRLTTENITNNSKCLSHNKLITRETMEELSDKQSIINQMIQKQNERYSRIRTYQDQDVPYQAKIVRQSKRELINVKLSQFKKKQQKQTSNSKLPQLKHNQTIASPHTEIASQLQQRLRSKRINNFQ